MSRTAQRRATPESVLGSEGRRRARLRGKVREDACAAMYKRRAPEGAPERKVREDARAAMSYNMLRTYHSKRPLTGDIEGALACAMTSN